MYQTDFICTYKRMPEERLQEELYSVQLLQAFGMEVWNDTAADLVLDTTIQQIQSEPVFRYILTLAKANEHIAGMANLFSVQEYVTPAVYDAIVFRLLFSYDFFDMTHRCVSDWLRESHVKEEHYVALCQALASSDDHTLNYATFCASLLD